MTIKPLYILITITPKCILLVYIIILLLFKFFAGKIFQCFQKIFCSRLHLFDQKCNKSSSIAKYYIMLYIPVMRIWIFSIITPVFSVTWSSEIILMCFAAQ